MRIAVVSIGSFDTQYSDYHIMRDIVIGLLERGHAVDLIQKQYLDTPQYPDGFYPYLGKQLTVHPIRFERKARSDLKARYLADLRYYHAACRLMKKNLPDRIFLQSNNTAFYPVFYAKHIAKRPLIYNEQDIFPENALFAGILNAKSPVYRVAHALQKYAYRNASALSTISDDMKSTIVTRYGIPESRIQVIYNWGHEELKAHSDDENIFLKQHPRKPGEFRVLYAGNLGKMQNVELILETASLMKSEKDILFYIVGNGANEAMLKAYAHEHELTNVTFVGMRPPEEVADLYASADVNVIPLAQGLVYAALPSKTADCFIAGKPIILCLDEKSVFSDRLGKMGIRNAGPVSAARLKDELLLCRRDPRPVSYSEGNVFVKEALVARHCIQIEQAARS